MNRSIDNNSLAALKHLRKAPAALAVYWAYVAATNEENVTRLSLADLQRLTGWDKRRCQEGRKLLVELAGLQPLAGRYVRPEWREMSAKKKASLVNLDKSEYFTPSDGILVAGKRLPLLALAEVEPQLALISDVSPLPTSEMVVHRTADSHRGEIANGASRRADQPGKKSAWGGVRAGGAG